jgi:hypothetical protein
LRPAEELPPRLLEDFFAEDFFAEERLAEELFPEALDEEETRPVVRLEEPRPADVPVRPLLFAEAEPRPDDPDEDPLDADLEPDFFAADFEPEEREVEPEDFEPADLEPEVRDPDDVELDRELDFELPRWDEPRELAEREVDFTFSG